MSYLTLQRYHRDRIYKTIYGDLYKCKKLDMIRSSFEIGSSKIKHMKTSVSQNGGDAQNDKTHADSVSTTQTGGVADVHDQWLSDDSEDGLLSKNGSEDDVLRFKIVDTFKNYNTNNILFGKKITNYAKVVIMEVIKFYQSRNIKGNTDVKRNIINFLNKVLKDKDINYDKLMLKFHAESNECLLAYMLIAFQNEELDLMLRTTYTFGRVLPLNSITEWFDNYRLNSYCNGLNMVQYRSYDSKYTYAVDYDCQPINNNVEINYDRVLKFLVGSLRAFIIDRELYPERIEKKEQHYAHAVQQGGNNSDDIASSLLHGIVDGNLNENAFSVPFTKKTPKEICDTCYKRYPFFFGGSHGCDVFDMSNLSLSLEEIKQFLDRYPSARVGYILNTATYRSGNGEHWVALELTKGKAKLICSQQSDFSAFKDSGRLNQELQRLGFGEEWNTKELQKDDHSCGMFSAISLLKLLQYRGDIEKAVNSIGVNMEELGKPIGKESNVNLVIEKLAGSHDK